MCWLTIVLRKTFFLAPLFSMYSHFHEHYSFYYYSFSWSLLWISVIKPIKQWSHHPAFWWEKDLSSRLRSGSCFSLFCCVKSLWKPCKNYLQFIWPQHEATEQTSPFVTLKLSLVVNILGIFPLWDRKSLHSPSTAQCTVQANWPHCILEVKGKVPVECKIMVVAAL